MLDKFLVVIPTHRPALAASTITELRKGLTYPTDFIVLDGRKGKMSALNHALATLLCEDQHTVYTTVDDDIILPYNWQHSVACAMARVPNIGLCGIDMAGSDEGRLLMQAGAHAPIIKHKDVRFRDTVGYQNVAGACMSMRPSLARQIGPYPYADDGRHYFADEDGWRCHQVAMLGKRYGYVMPIGGAPLQFMSYQDSEEYTEKKRADAEQWLQSPSWP